MIIFYSENINEGFSVFPEVESKHAVQVLRKKPGDQILFVDGKGGYYEGIIHDPHPRRCVVQIVKEFKQYEKKDYYLHMAVAPTKNIDRFEWFLEKATEIGIDRITPIISFHSERKQVKTERLNRVIIAAMKQSLKAYKPLLDEPVPLRKFLSNSFDVTNKLIAHCQPDELSPISSLVKPKTRSLILIGPEGDFNMDEINIAKSNGFSSISLGKSRLRTETAAVVATHTVYYINQ